MTKPDGSISISLIYNTRLENTFPITVPIMYDLFNHCCLIGIQLLYTAIQLCEPNLLKRIVGSDACTSEWCYKTDGDNQYSSVTAVD